MWPVTAHVPATTIPRQHSRVTATRLTVPLNSLSWPGPYRPPHGPAPTDPLHAWSGPYRRPHAWSGPYRPPHAWPGPTDPLMARPLPTPSWPGPNRSLMARPPPTVLLSCPLSHVIHDQRSYRSKHVVLSHGILQLWVRSSLIADFDMSLARLLSPSMSLAHLLSSSMHARVP